MSRALVFTRTKRGADRVAKYLEAAGVDAASIHGDKTQGQRERALAAFKAGEVRALVATDIAARGIDVDAVTHVVNYELPNVPEAYVHRIGRTARAGADGSPSASAPTTSAPAARHPEADAPGAADGRPTQEPGRGPRARRAGADHRADFAPSRRADGSRVGRAGAGRQRRGDVVRGASIRAACRRVRTRSLTAW